MKRAIISGLVALLVLAAVIVTAGCGGGDTEQAKKYMKQGDGLADAIGDRSGEITASIEALLKATDPASRSAAWEQIQSLNNVQKVLLQKAKAEYQKIKELKGVVDYARYVELKTLALDAAEQLMGVTNDFLQKAYSNGFASQQELEAAQRKFQAEIEGLQEENDRANEEAQQLKKDKKL